MLMRSHRKDTNTHTEKVKDTHTYSIYIQTLVWNPLQIVIPICTWSGFATNGPPLMVWAGSQWPCAPLGPTKPDAILASTSKKLVKMSGVLHEATSLKLSAL